MKKNNSTLNESPNRSHHFSTTFFRIAIVAVCLVIIGTSLGLWTGRNSRAAGLQQQDRTGSPDGLWQDVAQNSIPARGERMIIPKTFRTVRLNMEAARQLLSTAPLEFSEQARTNPVELTLPMPDGTFNRFLIAESPMMEPKLAAQFPEIKTYGGTGIDDPTATMRFDITPKGFHAMVLSAGDTVYVDPYAKDDTSYYISYYKRDYQRDDEPFRCLVSELNGRTLSKPAHIKAANFSNAGILHTYRLAVAATGQYTIFQGGTVANAMAAITTTINRVNGIYGRDLSIRMTLIGNNANIIYTSDNDPYTNGDASKMIDENQGNLNSVIGSDNYDIGHVFGTNSGGLAEIRSVCDNDRKARGVTGSAAPKGDPFDVDYVAHEMGHQFGADHTFNDGNSMSCGGGNRAQDSAYEPGSGSTIMGYANICPPADLQLNSDDYFHAKSLEQIIAYTRDGGGSGCDTELDTGNHIDLIVLGSLPIHIPNRTPFRLDVGPYNDPDGDAVTYTWEEYDLGAASPPEGDDGGRPIFRSYKPSTNSGRTFPSLKYILNNANNPPATYNCAAAGASPVNCLTGESMPNTNRTMTFQQTVRDNHSNGPGLVNGGVTSFSLQVNVHADSGPFFVIQPNTNVLWAQGSKKTVTWNVANTNNAPVNCTNVRITLSTDGGLTFPIELAASTENDGSETVTLPNITTATARIKIEAVDNIFFDISDSNFSIVPLAISTTRDSGAGSLREAIVDANSAPGLSVITFEFPTGGVHTIDLLTPLPIITAPIIIDGWSQGGDGYSGPPLIELKGTNAGLGANGLTIAGGNSTVTGLAISRFNGNGIVLQSLGGNTIEGCYIGTTSSGTEVSSNGGSGVFINNSANNRLGSSTVLGQFRRNLIAGNSVGVLISGINASGNSLYYNYIGTNVNGMPLGNTADGIRITDAPNNTIGGTRSLAGGQIFVGTGNVISANGNDGIEITGSLATGNTIQANYIGLTPDGNAALGNFICGIHIEGSADNLIGGTGAAAGNTISGNSNSGGIRLIGTTSGTLIQGNYLGISADGSTAVRNNSSDIYVESANNVIGGTAPGSRNIISGAGSGIALAFAGATGNLIQGNYIGTDPSGTVALNSTGEGISLNGARNTTIGGTTPEARNIISGNGAGIHATGGTTNLTVQGNYIGTNPAGTAVVGNRFQGVIIEGSAGNTIGGTSAGAGNVISGNGLTGANNGITLLSAANNTVQGNFIGTNAVGDAKLGNGGSGIVIAGNPSSTNNIIGGGSATARNVVSGNSEDGIRISGHGNSVLGNYIGTDATGANNLGNGSSGIQIASGDNNVIGNQVPGTGNLIAFNGVINPLFGDGVRVAGGLTDGVLHGIGNRIRGNSIFSNVRLGIDVLGGSETSGVTANDACDADTGANNLQNYPVLVLASSSGGALTISGSLNSTAGTTFTVDFYANTSCGSGRTYLGSANVSTDVNCNGNINVTLPVSLTAGMFVTSTATDPAGNTSEFSACVSVTQGGLATPAGNNVNVQGGNVSLTFPEVTAAGNTTVAVIDPAAAGPMPSGYTLCQGCLAYEISTTATYVPPVSVCLIVPAGIDLVTFNSIKLLHGEGGVLVDRTTGRRTDPQSGVRTVCGSVDSLSPFVMATGSTPTGTLVNMSGKALYANGTTVVRNVAFTLTGPSGFAPRRINTDSNGNYTILNLPAGADYTLTPSKTGEVNGITAFDASLAARFAAQLISLTPSQQTAADASNNGSVSAFDASLIARTAANIANSGIAGSWKFAPASFTINNLNADLAGQNVTAILVGDVSGNWTPPAGSKPDKAEGNSIMLRWRE